MKVGMMGNGVGCKLSNSVLGKWLWVIFINLLCVNSVNLLWERVALYYFIVNGTKYNED
jgi:hypothetical protein